jgi:hypothetical protein
MLISFFSEKNQCYSLPDNELQITMVRKTVHKNEEKKQYKTNDALE